MGHTIQARPQPGTCRHWEHRSNSSQAGCICSHTTSAHCPLQTQGINSACGGAAVRIDVGMSAGCINAEPEARIRPLTRLTPSVHFLW